MTEPRTAAIDAMDTFASAAVQTAVAPLSELIATLQQELADCQGGNEGDRRDALDPYQHIAAAQDVGPTVTGKLDQVGSPVAPQNLNITKNAAVIEGVEVWGSINLGAYSDVVLNEFVVHGPPPAAKYTADQFCVFGSGDTLRGARLYNGRLLGQGSAWINGIRGGDYLARGLEIAGVQDGVGLTSQIGDVQLELNWIHDGFYDEWTQAQGAPSQGGSGLYPYAGGFYTHGDAVQFHRGKYYRIVGNRLGGLPKEGGLLQHAGHKDRINAGDDFYNSSLMIKQEVSSLAVDKIEDVVIENNLLAGGTATVNAALGGNGNTFGTLLIKRNRFLRTPWPSTYVITPTNAARVPTYGQWVDNVMDDDGSPVVITRG